MKKKIKSTALIILSLSVYFTSCESTKSSEGKKTNKDEISLNNSAKGTDLELNFESGKSHNHPTFAF